MSLAFKAQRMVKAVSLAERKRVAFLPNEIPSSVEGKLVQSESLNNDIYVIKIGARTVIAAISSRRQVSKLVMSHNRLGVEGFRELFAFLCSAEGRRYQIEEMDLHNCGIDDDALAALSEYVQNNVSLKSIQLQQVRLCVSHLMDRAKICDSS